MAIPRRRQFDAANPPWLHCISRCVRRAFLCGTDTDGRVLDHRRRWIEERLRLLAQAAACDVAGHAVMANHVHVVMRMAPERARSWSDREVVERWLRIWPIARHDDGSPVEASPEVVEALVGHSKKVAIWRQRLTDLGWTMKALKEAIARRANREDRCSGAFWEGRYKSVPLLDQAALTACMVYVDLNPIRAGVADRPESARHTSAYERIRVRQAVRRAAALRRAGQRERARRLLQEVGASAGSLVSDGQHPWLTPLEDCFAYRGRGLQLDDYLALVDATGRLLRGDRSGAVKAELLPLLKRLDLDHQRWLVCMLGWRQFIGAAVGDARARVAEASRRGLRWVQNRCALFAAAGSPPQSC